ncbi:hypothetical protein AA0119_g12096 [Alternaria tenuissima]|uniref:DDE-1 domain-containing protein n=1 Tax=Alternaria tenuissima TaxID=119927 RepID=A0ABY0FVY7_9PLEO|nr:hypothetical protein AA0120_g12222 [Alternaria tenuissima]RYN88159.1 hypothetical protein AA0119_g12096 [Alternaria tenuissima]RYO05979.1 hypothetical protein AA0121_g12200 [Alternaria tenuissima]
MANQLLAVRGGGQVGEKWASNLVRRKSELESRLTRQRDRQRLLCSDPEVISPWFDLVQDVKAKYGILDEDNYNFDETGFTMGVAGSVKVVPVYLSFPPQHSLAVELPVFIDRNYAHAYRGTVSSPIRPYAAKQQNLRIKNLRRWETITSTFVPLHSRLLLPTRHRQRHVNRPF